MRLAIIFGLEARVELIRVSEFYRDQSPELVVRFQAALDHCLDTICEFPDAFKQVEHGARRIRLDGFPYFLYYTFDPDALFIHAIAHEKQNQRYWHKRIEPFQGES